MKMGIDPVTHKPVSQVLSDLGSISGLSSNDNQMNFVEQTQEEEQIQSWEQIQQHMFSEVASSSSSSSSPNLTRLSSPQSYTCQTSQTQITPNETPTLTQTPNTTQIKISGSSSSFDWSEFLQNDPFISSLMKIEDEICNDGNSNEGFGVVACDARNGYEGKKQCEGNSSFVDGILDRDSEIRAEFPELLEGSFDY